MRILIGCLSLLFLGACGAGESTDDASVRGDEEAAEEVVQEFFGAIEEMDFVALEETVTSDFELVEDTLVLDFEGFIEFLRPFADAGAIMEYEFSDFNTETRGPVAWTRYRNSAVATMEGQRIDLDWLESAVMLRQDDGWRMDRLHSSPIRTDPQEAPG